jgi:NAD(P)-dependent dehydrogenase (short-subunit alcohol dehydrogenase family)
MASVLVTGTSSGIGLATALALARAGHKVHATLRDPDRGAGLAAAIAAERLPISILTMDVNSDSSVAETVERIGRQGDPIDALVNNAGIERLGAVEELPLDAFREVMETNYFGALRCIQAVLPQMRERRSGCIVNVTSISGRMAVSPMAPYAASKFALEAVSEILAQEVKPFNVRVAIIEPGVTHTPMAERVASLASVSRYPHSRRMANLFRAALANPVPPSLVAEAIRMIIESGTWHLRFPVGAGAGPFLDWRAGMSDEAWVELGALEDDAWYDRIKRDFGLDARPQK